MSDYDQLVSNPEQFRQSNLDSTLSSVYVTTESHEKRMRVAGQCALRFAGKIRVLSYFCFKILGNLKHRRFISTFHTWNGTDDKIESQSNFNLQVSLV